MNAPDTSLTVCFGCMASNGATVASALSFKLFSGSNTVELWLRGTETLFKLLLWLVFKAKSLTLVSPSRN